MHDTFFWHETVYCHVPSQVEPRTTKKKRFSFTLRLENQKKKKSSVDWCAWRSVENGAQAHDKLKTLVFLV